MVNLGEKVKDQVSGYEGIATSRTTYLNGCVRVGVQGKINKDKSLTDPEFFDEQQLEVVGSGYAPKTKQKEEKLTGGPQINPKDLGNPA